MPLIDVPIRQIGNEVVGEFVSSVSSIQEPFWFVENKTRNFLEITNLTTGILYVSVGTKSNVIVNAFESVRIENEYYAEFYVRAALGYGSFKARFAYFEYDEEDEKKMQDEIDKLEGRLDDLIKMSDYGAVGDGVTDDSSPFALVESKYTNKIIDLQGLTYVVNSLPFKNKYTNGKFNVGGTLTDASYSNVSRVNHGIVAFGLGAAGSAPYYPVYSGDNKFYKNVSIGGYALKNSFGSYNNIAIGWEAMAAAETGEYYNIAIGNESLWSLKRSATPSGFEATRNLAIGINGLRYLVKGHHNLAMGRNAAQCIINGTYNTIVGVNAHAGVAPLDLTGKIVSYSDSDATENTALGNAALLNNVANENTAVGSYAATNVTKATRTTAIGRNALTSLQKYITANGKDKTLWSKTGTYVWNGTTITVTMAAHGMLNGHLISLKLDTGDNLKTSEENQYIIQNVTTDTFDIIAPLTNNTSGTCSSTWYTNQNDNLSAFDNNTAVGHSAMENALKGQNNTVVGVWAGRALSGDSNVIVGVLAGTNLAASGTNTAVGYGALRYMQDGSNAVTLQNATGIGYDSRVSGSNQIQLGNASTTTYAYGAIQARSDMRDKIDIEDSTLGLEFIEKIPVREYRYNYRELYENNDNSSREFAGTRKHLGVIAQEVKEVMDEMGIDFSGYQDHSLNGGSDVKTIGYQQFIMPLMNAVKELSAENKARKAKEEQQDAIISKLIDRIEKLEKE